MVLHGGWYDADEGGWFVEQVKLVIAHDACKELFED